MNVKVSVPCASDFELVETEEGERWCRMLDLEFHLQLPEFQVPEILSIVQDRNAKAVERGQAPNSVPLPPAQP